MMNNQPKQLTKLEIGDEIGFVTLAQNVDDKDRVVFFPVVEVTTRDGERAYRYLYPDGQVSASAIKESNLDNYTIKIHRCEVIAPQVENVPNLAICLNDRKDEFRGALKRGMDNDLQVSDGWDKDSFFVTNRTNKSEYRVEFEAVDGRVYADCECADALYRKRICKHIAAVLEDNFFGVVESMGVELV
ncbi:MAG: SWIM zinc finger family protein [Bacteroidetes bacterium]|nr:SWIM zinc finger family protein [Bacteroidota bacterium]